LCVVQEFTDLFKSHIGSLSSKNSHESFGGFMAYKVCRFQVQNLEKGYSRPLSTLAFYGSPG
jgi:hypothetical protein